MRNSEDIPWPAETLSNIDQNAASALLEKLLQSFSNNCKFLQNPVKDLYYKLFLCLEDARHQQKIPGSGNPETVAETIDRCFTFGELHQTLVDKTEDFFKKVFDCSQENPTIFLIREYISKNYMNETLSAKDISSHVFLSTSYVCTFFKNKTGTIVLTGWIEGTSIVLLISDDGVGIPSEKLSAILSGNGNSTSGGTNIAVYNTHRRLQILYGPDYGLTYSSTPGSGTEVEIRIPAIRKSATEPSN